MCISIVGRVSRFPDMTSHQLWMFLSSLLLHGYNSLEFTSVPGVIRVHTGQDAVLIWGTQPPQDATAFRDLSNPAAQGIMTCEGTIVLSSAADFYGRVNCGTDDSFAGFVLQRVVEADAGNYTCRILTTFQENSMSVIYMFKGPSSPRLTLPSGVAEGGSITLLCTVQAESVPAQYRDAMTFMWRRNGTAFTTLDRHTITNDTLTVTSVQRDDKFNSYSCQAQEKGSTLKSPNSNYVSLDVFFAPIGALVTKQPHGPVRQNQTITITCSLQDPGNPASQFDWYKETVLQVSSTNPLMITAATVDSHDGDWQCAAHNGYGPTATVDFNIVIYAKPSVTSHPSDTVLRDEATLSVSCHFRGKPSVTVEWKSSNGQGALSPALKYDTSIVGDSPPNQKYNITAANLMWNVADLRLRQSATGRYYCIGTNAAVAEPETSEQMYLNVTFAPHSVTANPPSEETTEGESSSTSCSAECNPNCWSYEWTKQSNSSFLRHGHDLQFSNVHRNDHGVFECRTSNGLEPGPSASAEYGLLVNYAPDLDVSKSTVSAQEGETVELQCDIDSHPDPTALDWYNQRGAMQHTSKTGRQVMVEMTNVDCPDAGTYQCKATNKIGSRESAAVTLAIKCSPNVVGTEPAYRLASSTIGDTVIFKVMFYANTDPTLKWEFIHTSNDSARDWPGNADVVIVDNGVSRIIISRVEELNFGKYRCTGTNTVGSLRGGPVDFELRAHDSTDNTLVIIGTFIAVVGVLVVIGVVLLVLIRRGNLPGMKKNTDSGSKDVLELGGTTHPMYEEGTGESAPEMKTPTSVTYENVSAIPAERGVVVYENSSLQTAPAPSTYEEIHLLESSTYQHLDPKSRVPQEVTKYAAISSQPLEVVPEDIVLGELLHQGNIFTLRSGRMQEKDVVAKSLTALPGATYDDRHKLTTEISATLLAGTHQHVLSALGTTRIHDQECILYPLMKNGDLRAFLRTKKNSPDCENFQDGLSSNNLLRFALDVARGMAFLHTKEFLHPCLRASAVLLGAGNICKVTGFLMKKGAIAQLSLMRKMEELPVRWLAPEVIEDCTAINSKSDIWSYGVVLWEIYEFGDEPYDAMTADDVIKYVCEGNNLTKPKRCSATVFDVMKRCWMNTFKLRLSFESVVECLEEMA